MSTNCAATEGSARFAGSDAAKRHRERRPHVTAGGHHHAYSWFRNVSNDWHCALVARYGLVVVLAWFGAMKFTSYESHGISHWVANSPFLGWVYNMMSIDAFGRLNGSVELITAALLAVKPWFPKASVVGGALASLFFVTTLSFMITTPGSVRHLPAAFQFCPPTESS